MKAVFASVIFMLVICLMRIFFRLPTKNNTIATPLPGLYDYELFMITLYAGFETVFFKNTMFRNNDWLGNPAAIVSSRFQNHYFDALYPVANS